MSGAQVAERGNQAPRLSLRRRPNGLRSDPNQPRSIAETKRALPGAVILSRTPGDVVTFPSSPFAEMSGAKMRGAEFVSILCAALSISLAGCSTRSSAEHPQERAHAEANVGKTYWLTSPVLLLCKSPGTTTTGCIFAPKKQPLIVDGVADSDLGVQYHVSFSDGQTGYVRVSEFDTFATMSDVTPAAGPK